MDNPYIPELAPPEIFGEKCFGIAFANKTRRANVQSTGRVRIGDNWRQLATTREYIWRDLLSHWHLSCMIASTAHDVRLLHVHAVEPLAPFARCFLQDR